MKVCKFNPITGESYQITQKELEKLKEKRKKQQNKVIMCGNCKLIVHQSTSIPIKKFQQSRKFAEEINSFKNVRAQVKNGTILFFCNQCAQQVGNMCQPSSMFRVNNEKVIQDAFQWRGREDTQRSMLPSWLTIGSYRGIKIKNLEKIICRLMYLKCRRYQTAMTKTIKNLKAFQNGFNNFINLINIYKFKEEQQMKNKTTSEQSKLSFPNSRYENENIVRKKLSIKNKANMFNTNDSMDKWQITTSTTPCLNTAINLKNKNFELLQVRKRNKD